MSVAEYVIAPFYPDSHPPELVVKCATAVDILVVTIVNVINVRVAIRIQVVFLVAKVLAMTVIVTGGIVELVQSSSVIVENLKVENAFKGTQYSFNNLGIAFYQGLWSYGGWYNLDCVYKELKRPEVTMYICIVLCVMYFIQQYNSYSSQQIDDALIKI